MSSDSDTMEMKNKKSEKENGAKEEENGNIGKNSDFSRSDRESSPDSGMENSAYIQSTEAVSSQQNVSFIISE